MANFGISKSTRYVTKREQGTMNKMHAQGMSLRKIANITGRSVSTVSNHVLHGQRFRKRARGQPPKINARTKAQLKRVVVRDPEVTYTRLQRDFFPDVHRTTALRTFKRHGIQKLSMVDRLSEVELVITFMLCSEMFYSD